MLPVIVINLARSPDRWQAIAASAEGTTLALHRIEAIDGAQLDANLKSLPGLDTKLFVSQHGRYPLRTEYACYRSHLAALDLVIERGYDLAIIAEDDILLNAALERRVRSLVAADPDIQLMRLTSHRYSAYVTHGRSAEGDAFGRCIHGPQGSAACYAVTREAAIKLRAALATMSLPYDVALESGWLTEVATYSTSEDLVKFQKVQTTIANESAYRQTKLRSYQSLDAVLFRGQSYANRMSYALQTPMIGRLLMYLSPPRFEWPALALVMVMISTLWLESDAYRYAALGLFAAGIIPWLIEAPRAKVGVVAYACIAWALYVAARMGFDMFRAGSWQVGTAEGIYLLPIAYSCIGYTVARCYRVMSYVPHLVVAISLACILATFEFRTVLYQTSDILFTNNTIHSSVCVGLIAFAAVNVALWNARRPEKGLLFWLTLLATSLVIALGCIALFGARSKGVWMAFGGALLVQLALLPYLQSTRRTAWSVAAAGATLALGIVLVWQTITATFAPSIEASGPLLEQLFAGEPVVETLKAAIESGTVPVSMNERLMLWVNALEVWSQNWIFGNGILWEGMFRQATYGDIRYNLLHNSYFEIGVRYGIVGLILFLLLQYYVLRQSFLAARQGAIPREAFAFHLVATAFFMITMLTNSNIRLAIGESFVMVSAAFGFYCMFRMQPLVTEERTFPLSRFKKPMG